MKRIQWESESIPSSYSCMCTYVCICVETFVLRGVIFTHLSSDQTNSYSKSVPGWNNLFCPFWLVVSKLHTYTYTSIQTNEGSFFFSHNGVSALLISIPETLLKEVRDLCTYVRTKAFRERERVYVRYAIQCE